MIVINNYNYMTVEVVGYSVHCTTMYVPYTDFDSACGLFSDLRKKDPFKLTDLDVFSNVLFVMVRILQRGHC